MDKLEGLLKPLKYDKNNTVFNNTVTALSPNYERWIQPQIFFI